jgi:hypothetical protein
MTLGVFVTSTVAWFDISNNLIVNNLSLSFSDDPGIKIAFSKDGQLYSDANQEVLKNEAGVNTSASLSVLTSAFQSEWLNDKTIFDDTMPILRSGPDLGNKIASSGFIQLPLYFVSSQDGYIYLDKTTTFSANDEANEKSARHYNVSQESLDKIEGCSRVSFYSEDYGFKIYEPNAKTPSKTLLGGRLDLNPFDGYFDYNSNSKREELFGEYNRDEATLFYGLATTEDSTFEGNNDCFHAATKAGIAPLDIETSIAKGDLKIAQETTHVLSELTAPEDGQSVGMPITYCYAWEPKKVIVTIYVEGWDFDTVTAIAQASFDFKLVFTAVYMPKIDK